MTTKAGSEAETGTLDSRRRGGKRKGSIISIAAQEGIS